MDFEQTIRQYVFLGRPSAKGWCQVLCRVCNDHGRKGLRSAFKFGPDEFGYHCFNCEIGAQFSAHSQTMPSEDMEKILSAFGVPEDFLNELKMLVIHNRTNGTAVGQQVFNKARTSGAKVLEVPSFFKPLSEFAEDEPIRQLAEMHLAEERAMTSADYPFYIAMRDPANKDSFKFSNRLVIPIYNSAGQLIFWQARDIIGGQMKKYLNPDVERDGVLYGMAELQNRTNAPLFITEGFFDAFHMRGVATLGRQLTNDMIELLDRCPREKIIIPDFAGSGQDLALQGVRHGWKVSIPEFGQCKDVTEAIVKYGKLYVYKNIMDNIYSGTAAETMIGLHCK